MLGQGVILSVLSAHTFVHLHCDNLWPPSWKIVRTRQHCLDPCILFKGRTQEGLMIILGTTIGAAFVESLYEHRMKYDDVPRSGRALCWSSYFVTLINVMMSCIFYFANVQKALNTRSNFLDRQSKLTEGENWQKDSFFLFTQREQSLNKGLVLVQQQNRQIIRFQEFL